MKVDLVSATLGGVVGYAAVRLHWLDPVFSRLCDPQSRMPSWLRTVLCGPSQPSPNGGPIRIPEQGLPASPPSGLSTAPLACPNLDGRLAAVQWASNPADEAARQWIAYQGGQVRVVVAMQGTTPDRLASVYGFRLESQAGNVATGWVAVGVLCGLSQMPGVLSVRPA